MITLLVEVWLSLAAGVSPASTAPCSAEETRLWNRLTASETQMEPEGARLRVHEAAVEALKRCPGNERIAYVSLRAAELVPDDVGGDAEFLKFTQAVVADFPRSVRIATIRARREGSVSAARNALAIDRSYAPAQVALAAALLAAGDKAGARAVIDGVKDLEGTDDGYAVLARICWAERNAVTAIDAARRALRTHRGPSIEPGSADVRARAQAHEILGLAYLEQGHPEAAAPHLLQAEQTSPEVQAVLKKPSLALRNALTRARRSATRR